MRRFCAMALGVWLVLGGLPALATILPSDQENYRKGIGLHEKAVTMMLKPPYVGKLSATDRAIATDLKAYYAALEHGNMHKMDRAKLPAAKRQLDRALARETPKTHPTLKRLLIAARTVQRKLSEDL